MELAIKIANALSCAWLGFCAMLFYIILYGDSNQMVHRWNMVQHWSLKVGLVGIICGSAFNALSWNHVHWSSTVLNAGLAMVFHWAYMYHRKLFIHQSAQEQIKNKVAALESELSGLTEAGKKKYNTL